MPACISCTITLQYMVNVWLWIISFTHLYAIRVISLYPNQRTKHSKCVLLNISSPKSNRSSVSVFCACLPSSSRAPVFLLDA